MKYTLMILGIILLLACRKESSAREAVGDGDVQKVKEVRWYIPEPPGHPWADIAKEIAAEIKGRDELLDVKVYDSGALGTQGEAVNMLRAGTLEILASGPSMLASFFEPVQALALPYIFSNPDDAYRYLNSDVGQRLFNDTILKKSGIRTIDFWYFGDRVLSLNSGPIEEPSDLSGVKVRSMNTPVAKTVVASLGANPIPINFPELYIALQTGVVQGQENPIPTIIAQKFYEVQDTIVLTNHSVHMGSIHVADKFWNSLKKQQRELISSVFAKFRPVIEERIKQQALDGIEFLKNKGVTILEPDLQPFRDNAASVIEDNYGDKADWMQVIQDIREAIQ